MSWLDEEMRSGLINRDRQMYVTLHRYKKSYGDVALQEAEIREKIKIEIAFQSRLALAFDKEGYLASDVTDEAPNRTKRTSSGEGEENGPDRTLSSWQCFRALSKDVTIPYWLTVWFFGDKAKLPPGLRSSIKKWRTLCGDDICESGSSKVKELEGMSFDDATMPHCCHLLVKEERLLFETLPLPVMRATLLDGHLAEELASKVALAFDRIRAITVERVRLLELQMPNDIKRIVADHYDMFLPVSSNEARQVALFLCRKLAGMTLPQLAERFCRPLSAVIYACKVVEYRMQSEPAFRDTVIQIVRELGCKYWPLRSVSRFWKLKEKMNSLTSREAEGGMNIYHLRRKSGFMIDYFAFHTYYMLIISCGTFQDYAKVVRIVTVQLMGC